MDYVVEFVIGWSVVSFKPVNVVGNDHDHSNVHESPTVRSELRRQVRHDALDYPPRNRPPYVRQRHSTIAPPSGISSSNVSTNRRQQHFLRVPTSSRMNWESERDMAKAVEEHAELYDALADDDDEDAE